MRKLAFDGRLPDVLPVRDRDSFVRSSERHAQASHSQIDGAASGSSGKARERGWISAGQTDTNSVDKNMLALIGAAATVRCVTVRRGDKRSTE